MQDTRRNTGRGLGSFLLVVCIYMLIKLFQSLILCVASHIDVYAPDGVEFAESAESEATGEQINEWLQICMKSHDGCKKPPAWRGEFPSRLVAVEDDEIKVIGLFLFPGRD
jgi:hypothetical protein